VCLVILGDDPILDAWKWLKLDRKKKKTRREGSIYWLPDDTLPSTWETQVKLMQLLTELGVMIKSTAVRQGGRSS